MKQFVNSCCNRAINSGKTDFEPEIYLTSRQFTAALFSVGLFPAPAWDIRRVVHLSQSAMASRFHLSDLDDIVPYSGAMIIPSD